MGARAAYNLMQLLENASNVERVNTWFRWNLITADLDDNKFVDCAIACSARYIVSEDRHFKILEKVPFIGVEVLRIDAFKSSF